MLKKDYKKLYLLQDKFLNFWKTVNTPFYLTGGTALSRFYLDHRYSEDLDFFVNNDKDYKNHINTIYKAINKVFSFDIENNLFYDDFTRLFIVDSDISLKLEFVNDIPYRTDKIKSIFFGKIDTPINILSNKLSALINRDEPKDIFDIIHLSLKYKFNWKTVFFETKEKNIINEIDVEQKINTFPVALFDKVEWFIQKPDYAIFSKYIKQISDDFITGSDNSICKTNINIKDAKII
ncbi:MAG: nucleotidyl transferase AbiEii/AbiGii toxin family protein [Bacteroidota bacterium]|nr:nucleotidyl transferase AbiEii/AbiGii toxin family protein [Bacteroidota bacterium]